MKQFLKIILISIVVIFLIGSMSVFLMLSSAHVMQAVLKTGANHFFKDIIVKELVIKRQIYRFSQELIFEDVSFRLRYKTDDFDFHFKTIEASELMRLLGTREGALLELNEGSISSSAFKIKGLQVDLVSQKGMSWAGTVYADEAEGSGFQVKNIRAKAIVTAKEAILSDMLADSYEGKLKGTVYVYFTPLVCYVADITFEELQTTALEKLNASFFSQIRGEISGTIHLKGPAGGLDKIEMNIVLGDKGEVQAQILSPLLAYLPASTQSKSLQTAIEQKQLISVSSGRLELSNKDAKTVATDIHLKSDNLNLDVNVTVDMIIDSGLKSLLDNFNQLFLFMKGT